MIIDGRQYAKEWLQEFPPTAFNRCKLAVVLIGNDPASLQFVEMKRKKAEVLGVNFEVIHLQEDTRQELIISHIKHLNTQEAVTGILVQLPLPPALKKATREILDSIDPAKDVDCLTTRRLGAVLTNPVALLPATVQGILHLLRKQHVTIQSRHCVIIGASLLVGTPLALTLERQGATTTVCNEYTSDLATISSQADILISATGVPRLIGEKHVKKGAVVIDVGTNKLNGELVGDVDFDTVHKVASVITPVPGGVGPMTIAALFFNLLQIQKNKNSAEAEYIFH